MIRIGIGNRITDVYGGSAWTPKAVAGLAAWHDVSVVSSITKDGSNFVSRWVDLSGNSRDLVQLTGANQPLYSAAGITFDGINDSMSCNYGFGVLPQPVTVFMVFKDVSWVNGRGVISGTNIAGMRQQGSGPTATLAGEHKLMANNAAGLGCDNQTALLNVDNLCVYILNGASSSLQFNNSPASTTGAANVGTNAPDGLILGARSGASNFSNIRVSELLIYDNVVSAGNITLIKNYLKAKWSTP